MTKPIELPALQFESKKKWADWFAKQHDKPAGVWMKLAKKGVLLPTQVYGYNSQ